MELWLFLIFLLNSQHFVISVLYSNDFAVELATNEHNATVVAKAHGFDINSKLDHLNVYHFVHPDVPTKSALSAVIYVNKLLADPRVKHVSQQEHLVRSKRNGLRVIHDKQKELPTIEITDNSLYQRLVPRIQTKEVIAHNEVPMKFDDPYFVDQWYLNNMGQTGGRVGLDLNVGPAWKKNFTGSGVVVCILDDGIDHTHPDLIDNYDAAASIDLNGDAEDLDPMPDTTDPNNGHGTHCAGAVVAKANNSVCGVGVAYEAKIGGVRMLDGTITDILEYRALFFKSNYIDIYSASWGPIDDGSRMEAPKPFAKAALQEGVRKGRNGLGVIYVWATGNGGLTFDDCNADGYVSSVETLAVGSVTNEGKMPYFMEQCTSTLAVIPTGGLEAKPNANTPNRMIEVVTTGLHGQCIENFDGTSGAAPLAAGCIALVLQANPHLTWRDVQHLVVHSARIPSSEGNWFRNGAGFHVSLSYGFGLMDCSRMVELAQNWQNVPPQKKCIYTSAELNKKVSFAEPIKIQIFCNGCSNMASSHLTHLEHVEVHINLKHSSRGDVQIFLISPAGTKSQLLSPRKFDRHNDIDFYFMTVHNWMENPYGNWTLEILDKQNNQKDGILLKWSLILYGYKLNRPWKHLKSRKMTPREIGNVMKKEFSRKVNIKNYENPLLKENLRMFQKSDLKQKIELIKNISSRFTSRLAKLLTTNKLSEQPRSVAKNLMLTLKEKVVNSPHKSRLIEEFKPRSKSITPELSEEMITNDNSLNKPLDGSSIGSSLQENGNQISITPELSEKMIANDNALNKRLDGSSIGSSLQENGNQISITPELSEKMIANDNALNKRLDGTSIGRSLQENGNQISPKISSNSLESKFEKIVEESNELESKFLTLKKMLTEIDSKGPKSVGEQYDWSNLSERNLDSLSTKPNFLKKNSSGTRVSNFSRNVYAERMFIPEFNLINEKSATEESEQPEELEDELEITKQKQESIDGFKIYPRSAKKQVT